MSDATISPPVKTGAAPRRPRLWPLEALRGLAALHVMINHIFNSYLNVQHGLWNLPFRCGQEGVLIFFLLSGFVICYAHGAGDADPGGFKTYLIKRGRRIYPIFLLSLLLAYVVALVARGEQPDNVSLAALLGNCFMLQDGPTRPGVLILPFADNGPLWSLSYEWWFYMMFYPINRWVPAPKQKYLVLGLCILGLVGNQFAPGSVFNFLIFFLVWWAGAELAREFMTQGKVTFGGQRAMLALLTVPALWYAAHVWQFRAAGGRVLLLEFPFLGFRYFFVAMLLIVVFFVWQRWHFAGFRQTVGLFEPFGAISYGIYLFHYPLIKYFRFFNSTEPLIFYSDLCLRILVTFLLAWLAEGLLQKWINSTTNSWLKRPGNNPQPSRPG